MEKPSDDAAILARTAEGEACLVGRIAAGDRRAFEALYRAYFPRLTRFLQRMTRSSALIEEIVNDTLLVVWRKALGAPFPVADADRLKPRYPQ